MNNEYYKLSVEELTELAAKIKYLDIIPVEDICDGVIKFWGKSATKAELSYCDEYNDNTYDLKLSHITVFDSSGKELNRINEGDDKADDEYYDWKYSLDDLDSESYDGDREVTGIEIDLINKSILGIPELYIKK